MAEYERISRPKLVYEWGGQKRAFTYIIDHTDYLLYMKGKARMYYVTKRGTIARKSDGRPLSLIMLRGAVKGPGYVVRYLDGYNRNLRRSNLALVMKND